MNSWHQQFCTLVQSSSFLVSPLVLRYITCMPLPMIAIWQLTITNSTQDVLLNTTIQANIDSTEATLEALLQAITCLDVSIYMYMYMYLYTL